MTKTQLAKDLGISRTMLYKLSDKGMPTDSLEEARKWRDSWLNISMTQRKDIRVDGNTGVKRERDVNELDALSHSTNDIEREVLTAVIPEIWFNQAGWLGCALKDNDIEITPEKLIRVQQMLFMIYMESVTEYLEAEEDELFFTASPIMMAMPGQEIYPSLIKRLNQILTEPTH